MVVFTFDTPSDIQLGVAPSIRLDDASGIHLDGTPSGLHLR